MTPDATTLCRHYADVLRASGRSERTIDNYLYSLKGFTRFLGERPLEQATADDIVAYQVDVVARSREILGADAPLLLAPPGESRTAACQRIFDADLDLCPECRKGKLVVRARWRATRLPLDCVIASLMPRAP